MEIRAKTLKSQLSPVRLRPPGRVCLVCTVVPCTAAPRLALPRAQRLYLRNIGCRSAQGNNSQARRARRAFVQYGKRINYQPATHCLAISPGAMLRNSGHGVRIISASAPVAASKRIRCFHRLRMTRHGSWYNRIIKPYTDIVQLRQGEKGGRVLNGVGILFIS